VLAKWLVSIGLSILEKNHDGLNAIEVAQVHHHNELAQWLSEEGLRYFDDRIKACVLPQLKTAVHKGRKALSQCLMSDILSAMEKHVTDIDSRVLLYAAGIGDIKAVRYLSTNHNVNINYQDSQSGMSAMHYAILNESKEVIEYLISNHADIGLCDANNLTSYEYAKHHCRSQEFCDWLKNYCKLLNITIASESDNTGQEIASLPSTAHDIPVLGEGSPSEMALCSACIEGNESELRSILAESQSLETDVNYVDKASQYSVLQLAAMHGWTEIIRVLLSSGANVNYASSRDGNTALHITCDRNFIDASMQLIRSGGNLSANNINGDTPLHLLCYKHHAQLMSTIIDLPRSVLRHLNLSVTNNRNENLIHATLKYNCSSDEDSNLELVKILIKQKLDLNQQDCEGRTALHYCCLLHNSKSILTLLVNSHNVNCNISDINGDTPLLLASSTPSDSSIDLCNILLEKGKASVHATNQNGDSALHCACRNGNDALAKLLVRHGSDPNSVNQKHNISAVKIALEAGREDLVQWMLMWILGAQMGKSIEDILIDANEDFKPSHVESNSQEILHSDTHITI
jgi:ankyrin repeat protein